MTWRNPGQKERDGQSMSHEAFQMYQPEEPLQNVVLNLSGLVWPAPEPAGFVTRVGLCFSHRPRSEMDAPLHCFELWLREKPSLIVHSFMAWSQVFKWKV